jgi:hypothetical protein
VGIEKLGEEELRAMSKLLAQKAERVDATADEKPFQRETPAVT